MQNESSTGEETDDTGVSGASIELGVPLQESDLFKHGASAHVLNFLSDNPDINVSLRQLARVTPFSERATREAVDVLEANGLVETFHRGNARRVHINRKRLDKPEDPILTIPQTGFQTPVRVACRYIEDELTGVVGIVLFGSVARGGADRQSDIDLWVLVEDDLLQQRHAANDLVGRLADLRIPPSIAVMDAMNADFESGWDEIRATLESDDANWSSAERHSFEILVESPQSILGQTDRVDSDALFGNGITLRSSETLERVKLELLGDE